MTILIYVIIFLAGAGVAAFYYARNIKSRNREIEQITALAETPEKLSEEKIRELTKNLPSSLIKVLLKLKQNSNHHHEVDKPREKEESGTENEALRKLLNNLYLVNELGQQVTSSLDIRQSFRYLYKTINSMMDAAVLELCLQDKGSGRKKLFSNIEENENTENYSNNFADWSFLNNREVFLSDAEKDFGRYVFSPLVMPDGKKAASVMVFPVLYREQLSGTLSVISFKNGMFSEFHRDMIRLLLGYVAVAMENSLRHEELNIMKLRAEEGEKFKEQFLANMSHEIRTPINAVTGMTRLLLEKSPREDQVKYLESIRNASDSLLVIINDILDLSKIEAGKVELEKIDFSPEALLENILDIMRFKAEEKGLDLTLEIDKNLPPVLVGDPSRITQILVNLVGNAIKFTAKGKVAVTARLAANSKKNGLAGKCNIRFEVSDTGIGMNQEQISRLFTNYSQASSDTARKYGGTGLGLSISKQLVELHHGTIEVTSTEGKGSVFYFTIPLDISEKRVIEQSRQIITPEMLKGLDGIKILLADDNEYNRIVVRETLQSRLGNLSIDEAIDGSQALEMIRKNDYDLVLMDLVMPEMDGLEVTKHVRKTPSLNQLKILALTASVVKQEIDKCREAGMDGFVPKPFKPDELFFAIYKTISLGKNSFDAIEGKSRIGNGNGSVTDLTMMAEYTEGDTVRMKRQISLFISGIPKHIETLKKAVSGKDYPQIRIAAHSMKAQLRMAGAMEALELAEYLEQCAVAGTGIEEMPGIIRKLDNICSRAISELEVAEIKG